MTKFYKINEVAEMLRVSRRTLDRKLPEWVQDKKVSIVKLGRATRIEEKEFERLIESLKMREVK